MGDSHAKIGIVPSASAEKGPSRGSDRPLPFQPQQIRPPNSAMPQLCVPPAAIAEKRAPGGGVARPSWFRPQQTASPSALRAQACCLPADSAEKAPSGAQVSQNDDSP